MSKRVLFNGAVLVRPGAATKIDASQFENVVLGGLGTVALIGVADAGEPRVVKSFGSASAVKTEYGSGNLVEAAAMVADPSNDGRIPQGAAAIVCYKVNNSTKATLTKTMHVFSSRQYGLRQNSIVMACAVGVIDAVHGRILTISGLDADGVLVSETSPEIGAVAKFTIQYTGGALAATIAITATQIAATTTAGVDDFVFTFANYPTLAELIRAIDALPNFTATALITNAASFLSEDLDACALVDVKTPATGSFYATNFDMGDWCNNQSIFVTDVVTKGQTGPVGAWTAINLAGGTLGTATTSDWTTGLAALGGLRCNQVVPLASTAQDVVYGGVPGGTEFDSLVAGLTTHCTSLSSTRGRSERQGWVGASKNKADIKTLLAATNSAHICMCGQKVKRPRTSDGTMYTFPEWAFACVLAGMRAGAPLGEPLTWKYPNVQGIDLLATPGWSPALTADVEEMILAGLIVITEVAGKGYRIERGITTYTRTENDAYTEESLVQSWKVVAYDLRTALEDRYTGRPGTLDNIRTVPACIEQVLSQHRSQGTITDSVVSGQTLKAYRNIEVRLSGDQLSVGVTISPTPGINFVLNTLVLVPARMS